ncbi:hypothetical protein HYV70_00090 [Candidatus Uhrbacteria bacterium]|nr:hypothetical protein [Candidatus Uhrbacteria bacterium]
MPLTEEIKKGVACDSVDKPHSILGRAVCLSVHPGKMLIFPFLEWFEKRYKGRVKFARLLFAFDLLLIGTALGIGAMVLSFGYLRPSTTIEDRIFFEATVAPKEIKTGASSTLIIHYTNEGKERLSNARLHLSFPDHFLLQELSANNTELEERSIELGTIPAGGSGSIKIRGVMFGAVGADQTFTSTLTFTYGENQQKTGEKRSTYTFSPNSSDLSLTLSLPDQLVAFQEIEGTIRYTNTGDIDFPMIGIEPTWPEGFRFSSSSIPLTDGIFVLEPLQKGGIGELTFTGYLDNTKEALPFSFRPSFIFETNSYPQDTLNHTALVVPPQIRVEQTVEKKSAKPGSETLFTLRYQNTGEFPVSDLVLSIESDSPFFLKDSYSSALIPSVAPNESGEVTLSIPLRSSLLLSETNVYEQLTLTTRAVATYTLGDKDGQQVTSKSSPVTTPLTTPVVLESFGRYATAGGDQIGRGPLSPRVGEQTTYWIFWHVEETFNELENVRIEGTLGSQVVYTGRQSSSQNGGAAYDPQTNTVSWETDLINPTFSPTSKIIGVAFEVGMTPNASMIGTAPVLMSNIHITGTDKYTGAFVSASGKVVTTNLPDDLMATGKSIVEE